LLALDARRNLPAGATICCYRWLSGRRKHGRDGSRGRSGSRPRAAAARPERSIPRAARPLQEPRAGRPLELEADDQLGAALHPRVQSDFLHPGAVPGAAESAHSGRAPHAVPQQSQLARREPADEPVSRDRGARDSPQRCCLCAPPAAPLTPVLHGSAVRHLDGLQRALPGSSAGRHRSHQSSERRRDGHELPAPRFDGPDRSGARGARPHAAGGSVADASSARRCRTYSPAVEQRGADTIHFPRRHTAGADRGRADHPVPRPARADRGGRTTGGGDPARDGLGTGRRLALRSCDLAGRGGCGIDCLSPQRGPGTAARVPAFPEARYSFLSGSLRSRD
jgi:hypothetical protein